MAPDTAWVDGSDGSRRGWLLAAALIAAPLLLVGSSWQEITAGPTAADVAAPSDPAGSADSGQVTQPSSRQNAGGEDDVP